MQKHDAKSIRWVRKLSFLLALVMTLVPGMSDADYLIKEVGGGQPFCEAILAALNKNRPTDKYRPCLSEVIQKLPGVSDPAWEELSLSEHEELAKEIITLSIVGSAEYFREKKLSPEMYPTPQQKQRGLEYAKEGGAKLYALRLAPELFGNKVLVVLLYKGALCGIPRDMQGEREDSAWVTSDLKAIATEPGIFDSLAGRPVVYQEQLYVMRLYASARELEIFVPRHEYLSKICRITYISNHRKNFK